MLFRKSTPRARLAGWAFVDLVALFSAISVARPAVGLAGLGATLVLAAILVEANKDMIWKSYKKAYRQSKDPLYNLLNKPNELYNTLNVYFVWPLVFILGLAAIYAAYLIAN